MAEPRSGVSKNTGNPWKSQDFVIETINEQYPRKMVFNVFGEEKLNQFNIQMGEVINVFFDINGREYNGKWYNEIRAWKVERPQSGQPAAAAVAAAPAATAPVAPVAQPFAAQDSTSDLPF